MISLSEPDESWGEQAATLMSALHARLAGVQAELTHIGSTSVPNLIAKPILDLLIAVPQADFDSAVVRAAMVRSGFRRVAMNDTGDREIFVRRRTEPFANAHVVASQSSIGPLLILHRDCLAADPRLADEYTQLKRGLAAQFPDSVKDYGAGKTDFFARLLANSALDTSRWAATSLAMRYDPDDLDPDFRTPNRSRNRYTQPTSQGAVRSARSITLFRRNRSW